MSGVYIPNIEMPKSCDDCPHPTCTLWQSVNGGERNEKCPIVSVPPHGRMGDLDALKERITNRLYSSNHGSMAEAYYAALIDLIDTAPTIIPASGGKENE